MTFDAPAGQALVWMKADTKAEISKQQVAVALKPFPKASVTFVKAITEAELGSILDAQAKRAEAARKLALQKLKDKEIAKQKRDASRLQYEIKLAGAKAEHSKPIRLALLGIDGVKRARFYSKTGVVLASVQKGDVVLTKEAVSAALADISGISVGSVSEAK